MDARPLTTIRPLMMSGISPTAVCTDICTVSLRARTLLSNTSLCGLSFNFWSQEVSIGFTPRSAPALICCHLRAKTHNLSRTSATLHSSSPTFARLPRLAPQHRHHQSAAPPTLTIRRLTHTRTPRRVTGTARSRCLRVAFWTSPIARAS